MQMTLLYRLFEGSSAVVSIVAFSEALVESCHGRDIVFCMLLTCGVVADVLLALQRRRHRRRLRRGRRRHQQIGRRLWSSTFNVVRFEVDDKVGLRCAMTCRQTTRA